MSKSASQFLLLIFSLNLLLGCIPKPYIDEVNGINSKDMILSDFAQDGHTKECPLYRDLKTEIHYGYCIYYDDATILVTQNARPEYNGLLLDYHLLPIYEWGNWFSIRQDAPIDYDLSNFSGIKLELRVFNGTEKTLLRITLVDINPNSIPYAADELWWCDVKNVLESTSDEWQVVVCPFKSFVLSNGFGARENDLHLDTSYIVAYEINIISPEGSIGQGRLELGKMVAYQ